MLIRKADVAELREQMKPEVRRICKNCGKEYWATLNQFDDEWCQTCLAEILMTVKYNWIQGVF